MGYKRNYGISRDGRGYYRRVSNRPSRWCRLETTRERKKFKGYIARGYKKEKACYKAQRPSKKSTTSSRKWKMVKDSQDPAVYYKTPKKGYVSKISESGRLSFVKDPKGKDKQPHTHASAVVPVVSNAADNAVVDNILAELGYGTNDPIRQDLKRTQVVFRDERTPKRVREISL